jgi:hypothetical protein
LIREMKEMAASEWRIIVKYFCLTSIKLMNYLDFRFIKKNPLIISCTWIKLRTQIPCM